MNASDKLIFSIPKHALLSSLFTAIAIGCGNDGIAQNVAGQATEHEQSEAASFQPFGSNGAAAAESSDPWKFEGRLHLEKDSNEGYIVLQIDLQPEHYIYSVSPKGSPAPTEISLIDNPAVVTQGTFSPNVAPKVIENDPVFNRRLEKHEGRVQFFIPCQIDANADFQKTGMPVIQFNGQVCSEAGICIPVRKQSVVVTFAGYFEREAKSASKPIAAHSTPEGQSLAPRR